MQRHQRRQEQASSQDQQPLAARLRAIETRRGTEFQSPSAPGHFEIGPAWKLGRGTPGRKLAIINRLLRRVIEQARLEAFGFHFANNARDQIFYAKNSHRETGQFVAAVRQRGRWQSLINRQQDQQPLLARGFLHQMQRRGGHWLAAVTRLFQREAARRIGVEIVSHRRFVPAARLCEIDRCILRALRRRDELPGGIDFPETKILQAIGARGGLVSGPGVVRHARGPFQGEQFGLAR